MKTPLIAILASLLLLPAAGHAAKDNPAPKPTAAQQLTPDIHSQIAAFNARVDYAKAHGEMTTCANPGGPLSCTVYTVKQGADGAPTYTLIIAKNTADASAGDITVLCDSAAIDPAHSIKCTGGIVATRGGVLTVGEDASTVLQLGLGQGDAPFTVTGAARMSKIN